MSLTVPITVPLVNLVAVNSVARIPTLGEAIVKMFGGSIRTLTLGTFSVDIRNTTTGDLLGTLSWTAPGVVTHTNLGPEGAGISLDSSDGLRFDITSVGVGASDCVVTVWMQVN